MKKNYKLLLVLGLFAFSSQIFAQSTPLKRSAALKESRIMDKKARTGAEVLPGVPLNPSVQFRFEEIIGATWYDLQSNGSSQERLIRHADGTMSAAWTMSQDQGGTFPDRGTGYNTHDGTAWGDSPNLKLEASARTGWPAICRTANGNEVIINHATSDSFRLRSLTLPAGSTTWVEADIPYINPGGMLWPRAAAGGPDGNTVHVIGVTTPSGNADAADNYFMEVDGHLLYYRSLDGGQTWDIASMIIPGLDSLNYLTHFSDSYVIDVRGNTVAIGVLGDWGDVAIFKSTDNGDTWTSTIVNQFPFNLPSKALAWNGHGDPAADGTYTFDDIYPDGVADPLSPNDSTAIRTSDGAGSILIDNDGMVHLWYGEMWVSADVISYDPTSTSSYFPATAGLRYWNESMGADNPRLIVEDIVDFYQDDSLTINNTDEIALYFMSLTSMPNTGIDVDGDLYLAYSGMTENYYDDNDGQYYRHIYLMKSTDNGANWSEPLDVITSEFVEDLFDFNEAIFPSLPNRNMDGAVNLMFMRDFKPGLSVRGDEDDLTYNEVIYMEINDDLISNVEDEISSNEIGFKVFPNPAAQQATLQLELKTATNVNIHIIDVAGKIVSNLNYGNLAFGVHQKTLNTNSLQNGTYFIQVRTDDGISTKKLMVLK